MIKTLDEKKGKKVEHDKYKDQEKGDDIREKAEDSGGLPLRESSWCIRSKSETICKKRFRPGAGIY